MATPPGDGHSEVLEHGPASPRLSPRRARLLLVVVLVVGASLALADRRVHGHEAAAVSRCVQVSTDAVTLAVGRVTAVSGYLRPALATVPAGRRQELLDLVSDYAQPGRAPLLRARSHCSATDVWPVHGDLRRTREDCLRLLAGELDFVEDVMADGVRAFGAPLRAAGSVPPHLTR